MTRRKRKKERGLDRRERPHLLRNEWHMFTPDPDRRARFGQELQRLQPGSTTFEDYWVIYQAAVRAGYTSRHGRRLAEKTWLLRGSDEEGGTE